ncbi:expressed unknown protein [Seminavis robusta]|uniref:BZIP domain-containing protein n=1 Tax=Seminavis robusta TaxID=568900 RepID=A0A9N8DRB8_9STRA|nr:expressed unknown protein [Seminavis robusta]|eukprot:Sro199_g084500.1 n/a (249) ;mRNA; r:78722-79468
MSLTIDQTNMMNQPDDDASDSGESTGAPEAPSTTAEAPNRYEKLERLKREKRLAMNRECARARRRRKKVRMELLESRVQELTQKNGKIAEANDALRMRVAQLEAELGAAASGMAMGMSAGGPDAAQFLGGNRMPGFASPDASQALLAEQLNLQRRAALVGLGGAETGLGLGGAAAALNCGNRGGNVPSSGPMGNGNMDALRYMQIMKARSAMREPSAGNGMHGQNAAALLGGQFGGGPAARGMHGADF